LAVMAAVTCEENEGVLGNSRKRADMTWHVTRSVDDVQGTVGEEVKSAIKSPRGETSVELGMPKVVSSIDPWKVMYWTSGMA